MSTRLLLAGCGKMGGAMLEGWLERGIMAPDDIHVVEPQRKRAGELAGRHRIGVFESAEQIPPGWVPDVIVLAVKPQMMGDVARQYRHFVGAHTVFLSIAAGCTLNGLGALLGEDAAVVRAMPNTPAAVRRGITVACANTNVSAPARALCQTLLDAVGETLWVEDESLLDGVTALSGSGPAYVFLLAESLAKAGVHAGLPGDLAERLARATVIGAAELLHRSAEPPATLRQNVTSPGGTTAAALAVLTGTDGWQDPIERAVAAATRRSRELAQ